MYVLQHQNNKITNLDLTNDRIGPEGTKYLSEALQVGFGLEKRSYWATNFDFLCVLQHQNNKITELNLRYNGIGDGGMKYLSEALQVCVELERCWLPSH
jgi:hypothetical protein